MRVLEASVVHAAADAFAGRDAGGLCGWWLMLEKGLARQQHPLI